MALELLAGLSLFFLYRSLRGRRSVLSLLDKLTTGSYVAVSRCSGGDRGGRSLPQSVIS
jgi:hypothetical protein